MPASATYTADLSRVRIAASTWGATVAYVVVDRYPTANPAKPTVVRGGAKVPMVTGQTLALDDYEFEDSVPTTYRVRAYNASNVEVPTYSYTATVTPAGSGTWLKFPLRPYLNRAWTVVDFDEVSRPAQGGLFAVLGRALPVATTDVRGSRRFALVLRTATAEERRALQAALAFGDVAFVQPPAGCTLPGAGYFRVEDAVSVRPKVDHDSQVRYWTLPLIEVAPPSPAVVGYTATYGGLAAAYATYATLSATFPSYAALSEWIASPSDETVA